MPRYILHHEGLYFEWSTVMEAPISAAMTKPEFEAYYQDFERELQNRLKRAEATGCSSSVPVMTGEECIAGNRAGDDENELSYDDVIAMVKEWRAMMGLPAL